MLFIDNKDSVFCILHYFEFLTLKFFLHLFCRVTILLKLNSAQFLHVYMIFFFFYNYKLNALGGRL